MTEEPRDDAGRAADGARRADAVVRHGDGERPRAGEEELFAALDRTRADLAAAPVPPLPPGFADRMRAELAAERARGAGAPGTTGAAAARDAAGPADPAAGATHPGPRPGAPSRPPSRRTGAPADGPGGAGPGRRRRRVLAYGLVALAVVAVVTGGVLAGAGTAPGPAPTAAPPVPPVPAPAPEPVSGADPVRALRAGLGARDPGPLTDPARRAVCLVAHGLPPGTVPLGSRQVLVDGRPGTLLVLPTGQAARFRLLVVGPGCTAADPDTLADLTVGG
jgi:hypothetical protein